MELALDVNRPRNVDWKRAAALLYGDWGTSKAYVIGLAFAPTAFCFAADHPRGVRADGDRRLQLHRSSAAIFPMAAASIRRRGSRAGCWLRWARCLLDREFPRHRGAERLGGDELSRRAGDWIPLATMAAIAVLGAINCFGPKHSGSSRDGDGGADGDHGGASSSR